MLHRIDGKLTPWRLGRDAATFEQYVDLRPARLQLGIRTLLGRRSPSDIEMFFIRENTEGEYSGTGGFVEAGSPHELSVEVRMFTPVGVKRAARYAFGSASTAEVGDALVAALRA